MWTFTPFLWQVDILPVIPVHSPVENWQILPPAIMMNQFEICLMATSGVAIAALFLYCNSGNGTVFNIQTTEEEKKQNIAKKKKRKRGERRTTSQSTQLSRKSIDEEEEEEQEDLEDGLVQKIQHLEVELTEVRMRNLKMVKIQENLEEKLKIKNNNNKKTIFQDAQVGTENGDCDLKEALCKCETLKDELEIERRGKEKLEKEMIKMKEEAVVEKEENKKLQKMLMEQQSVIRTALLRIFPKKQNNVLFCQEHLETIRKYEDKTPIFRQECK